MFPERLKSSMRKLFNTMGIEVHRRDSRSTLLGVLQAAKEAGLLLDNYVPFLEEAILSVIYTSSGSWSNSYLIGCSVSRQGLV